MKRIGDQSRWVLHRLFMIILLLLACDNFQSDFEKTKKLNTIEAYTRFIAKYPVSHLSDDAKNLRDQLAFEMTADSTATDSLAPLKTNVLENLLANAEQSYLEAKNILDHKKAEDEFIRAAKFYQRAAKIHRIVGKDTTEAYKRAAYALYKATLRSQNAQMALAMSALENAFDRSGSSQKAQLLYTLSLIEGVKKIFLYGLSTELFKKAGLQKHADWMKEGNTIKIFDLTEIEIVPDTVSTKQIHEK